MNHTLGASDSGLIQLEKNRQFTHHTKLCEVRLEFWVPPRGKSSLV